MYTAQVLTKFSAYLLINKRTQKYRENKKQILLLFVHSFLATISKAATSKVLLADRMLSLISSRVITRSMLNVRTITYVPLICLWWTAGRWLELHVVNSRCSRWHFQRFNKGSTMLLKDGQSFMWRTASAHDDIFKDSTKVPRCC